MSVPAPINLNKKALTDMLPLKKKKNHDGSILASLSPETPMHRYQGRKLLDVVTRREDLLVNDRDDTQSQYLIFSHIDERTLLTEPLNEDRDDSELDLLIHLVESCTYDVCSPILRIGASGFQQGLQSVELSDSRET